MLKKDQKYFHPRWKKIIVVDQIFFSTLQYYWTDIPEELTLITYESFIRWIKTSQLVLMIDINKIWKELNEA